LTDSGPILFAGDGDVRMKWSCGHEGYVNLDWLKRHSYASHTLENRRKSIHPELGKQAILPEVDIKELESDKGVLRQAVKSISPCKN
jgi:hypothetical protein